MILLTIVRKRINECYNPCDFCDGYHIGGDVIPLLLSHIPPDGGQESSTALYAGKLRKELYTFWRVCPVVAVHQRVREGRCLFREYRADLIGRIRFAAWGFWYGIKRLLVLVNSESFQ